MTEHRKKIKVTITMYSEVWNKFRACIILQNNNVRCISQILDHLMEQYIEENCKNLSSNHDSISSSK